MKPQSALGPVLLAVVSSLAASPARATFPGTNGEVVYRSFYQQQTTAIFETSLGQITTPRLGIPSDRDLYPRWSRDGEQIAFVRSDALAGVDRIMVGEKDGTGLHEVLNSLALQPGASVHGIANLAWTDDGRISFVYWDHTSDHYYSHGIWTVDADGSGLTQTVPEQTPNGKDLDQWRFVDPDWSASGRLVYPCFKKPSATAVFEELIDTCVFDRRTRAITRLGVKTRRPRWSPLGDKIVFGAQAFTILPGGGGLQSDEVFVMNADGSGLTRLTFAQLVACGNSNSAPDMYNSQPAFSPDGASIVLRGIRIVTPGNPCVTAVGLFTMPAAGGAPTLLVSDPGAFDPDWQPVVPKLSVVVNDGHGNPLRGLKVELRALDGSVVDDRPVNLAGAYAFAAAAPGTYLIRVTLIDGDGPPGAIPSFDVRHAATAQGAQEPVWVERQVTIADGVDNVSAGFSVADGPEIVDSNVAPTARHRLDDMANIFFRVRQFVDWTKDNLTPSTGPTVELYTFATNDPRDGDTVDPGAAYYMADVSGITFGTVESEYENRDGVIDSSHDDDAPENGEWHEFTHHLYATFVQQSPTTGESHVGYPNPDTSDSMDEGFAAFLATRAGRDIEGTADSRYDGMYDLEWNYKAWAATNRQVVGGFAGGDTQEDSAVASLFWDLVDDAQEIEDTEAIGALGAHHPVTYRDDVHLTIAELWALLTTARPFTVMGLRDAFGRDSADVVLDLDDDLLPDIAELDQIFLMHGFFPITGDQTLTATHATHHYDVELAQREDAAALRNGAVGRTDHRTYDLAGDVVSEQIPRFKIPLDPTANIGVDMRDDSGTPLATEATVVLTVRYPGFEDTFSRRVAGGQGLVHLELPPYFDYLLPVGASLPACDPAHDVRVEVTLAATVGGVTSSDQPSFDNCAYQRAGATATGPAALSFAFAFPAPPTTSSTTTSTTTLATTTSTTLPPNKCAGAKLKAAGKRASCLLALGAKTAKSGDPADPTKVLGCKNKFSSAFGKAEAKPPCLTTGDTADVEGMIDVFVAGVTAAIDVTPDPSKCQSKKLKAVGTKVKCLLELESKAAATAKPKDPAKVTGCNAKLSTAFAKAETGGDCGSATGDTTAIANRVDMLVDDVDTALVR